MPASDSEGGHTKLGFNVGIGLKRRIGKRETGMKSRFPGYNPLTH